MALFDAGFRPFFLLGSLHAALAVLAWGGVLAGWIAPPTWLGATRWHAHEMLFGVVSAAIAGFLLTAVPNWTQRPALRGGRLATLVALWLAGRLAMAAPDRLPPLLVAAVDVAFLPALALAVAAPIWAAGTRRNYVVPLLVLALGLADALVQAESLGWIGGFAAPALRTGVFVVAVVVTLIGGRIVPLFTANALRRAGRTAAVPVPGLADRIALPAVIACAALSAIAPGSAARGLAAAVAALALVARLARWQGHRSLGDPLVWSLHLGYAWLPIGYALVAGADLLREPWELAGLHALGAGAFGTMILAVASRVALGHSGRPLVAPPGAVAAYALATLGALLRVAGAVTGAPVLPLAAILWGVAFFVFFATYAPILATPRVATTSSLATRS